MKRRGLSAIITAVLLIMIGITIAAILLTWAIKTVPKLSPIVNCDGIKMVAEIRKENGDYHLMVANIGTLKIGGFTIDSSGQGTLKFEEEVSLVIEPGATEEIQLNNINDDHIGKTLVIIPKIVMGEGDTDYLGTCIDKFGYEIQL